MDSLLPTAAITLSRSRPDRVPAIYGRREFTVAGGLVATVRIQVQSGSPLIAINRAIAIAETDGPAAGLAALSVVESDARLA
jgi:hypothetical protein